MMNEITKFNNEKDAVNRNRNGVLLTNEQMIEEGINPIQLHIQCGH